MSEHPEDYKDMNRGHFFINGDDPDGIYYAVHDKHLPVVVAFLESLGCEKLKVGDAGGEVVTYSSKHGDLDADFWQAGEIPPA